MTSNTKCNHGRALYRCPQWRNKSLSCSYFQWKDEISLAKSSPNQRLISQLKRRNAAYELQLKRLRIKWPLAVAFVVDHSVAFEELMVAEETLLHDHQSLTLGQEYALALRPGMGMKNGMLSPGWPGYIQVRVLGVSLEIWMLCMVKSVVENQKKH
ncbi:hypothetical protein CDL15_Pgr001115 [Punica granatum]|uniref:GRF-type domain-containing protein n=1 Tax=Punica granatum TaxID=22663 RepID=A0A218WL88_PUNGR|nr:hypothetical protein CDL15_Pgr001115 [Punica granatum]